VNKAILYYTCCTHDPAIEQACRDQLDLARGDIPVMCVSREYTEYGDQQVVVEGEPGPLTMHKQILAGLVWIEGDVVFLCENDVMYHPSHFDFEPRRPDVFYYNTNVWRVRYDDGFSVWTDDLQQTSGLCADADLLWQFYNDRVKQIERDGFDRHFEPGPKVGAYQTENWRSECPNLDIRHSRTYTHSKWRPDQFRNKRYARGWRETFDALPGWGKGAEIIDRIKSYASI
jgi:hypothetical protein